MKFLYRPDFFAQCSLSAELVCCLWRVTWSRCWLCVDCFIMKMLMETP